MEDSLFEQGLLYSNSPREVPHSPGNVYRTVSLKERREVILSSIITAVKSFLIQYIPFSQLFTI